MSVEIELPRTLPEALALLEGADPDVRPVAGATDLLLRMRAGRVRAKRLVSIADLSELQYIRPGPDGLSVGAGTWVSQLLEHPAFEELLCARLAAREFASPQIRNRATLGGNLANASPAADMVPALIALGATVRLCSARAQRTLPVEDVLLGLGKTAIAADELAVEFFFPKTPRSFQAFAKFGNRGANVIAIVNMAMCLSLEGSKVLEARVAYGSVAPKSLRAVGVERFLKGKELSEKLATEIPEVVLEEISPIDDVRGSRRYKQKLAVNATQDALRRALRGAKA